MFAHGVGSRGDLPLPLWIFTWAAAIILVISFVALGVLWTKPRLADASTGRPIPFGGTGSSIAGGVVRVAGLVLFVVALWAGLFGLDDTADNLLPVIFYVQVWVGIQILSGIFGDVWRILSPINTLALAAEWLADKAGRSPTSQPPDLQQWPAAAGIMVFLFYELAHPSGSSPRTLAQMLLVHLAISMVLALRWGADWVAENEPFAVLFRLIAAMAPVYWNDGRPRLRAPMSGLSVMSVSNGTLATLLVVLGGTTFDGFSESEIGRSMLGVDGGWGGAATLTVGLLVSITLISALYAIGVVWISLVTNMLPMKAAKIYAPSLVPIVLGYALAHYIQLLVDETQTFWFRLSDPGGLGWDLFGAADGKIDFSLISVDLIAWLQVLAILVGHVGAVVVAHDRDLESFPAGESLRSQFAMLLVMVAYSSLGLWLLLNA